MKFIMQINKRVKLMVLSATIEEDEERYLEFYQIFRR